MSEREFHVGDRVIVIPSTPGASPMTPARVAYRYFDDDEGMTMYDVIYDNGYEATIGQDEVAEPPRRKANG